MRRSLLRLTLRVIPAFVPLALAVGCNDLTAEAPQNVELDDASVNGSEDAARSFFDAMGPDARNSVENDSAGDAQADGVLDANESDAGLDAEPEDGLDATADASTVQPVPDAGVDSGFDAGLDAGSDAPSSTTVADASADVGSDAAPLDSGTDAGTDAARDAGTDAGTDAGRDAGTDAGGASPTADATSPTDAPVDVGTRADVGSPDASGRVDASLDAGADSEPSADASADAASPVDATSTLDATPAIDAGFSGVDAGRDAGGDTGPASPMIQLSLDPRLDTAEDVVKATTFTSAILLDKTGATVATASVAGTAAQIPLAGIAAGDYFINVNSDPADLVPTRIDDPTVVINQRIGQKLRDTRIGPEATPTYRIRTWSAGQSETGFVYFTDGASEPGMQPYMLLSYAAVSAEVHALGTGETLLSLTGLANPHQTSPTDNFDSWILRSNDGGNFHGTSCTGCACHGNCTQKATTFAPDYEQGWCFTCHYGAAGNSAGFVDAVHLPPTVCAQTCTSEGQCTTTLVSGQSSPRGLAVEGPNLYWSNYGDGTIWKNPITCGQSSNVVAGGNHPSSLAVLAGTVYFNDWETASLGGSVLSAPVDGGAAPTVIAQAQEYPANLAVDSSNVYWTQNVTNIVRIPLAGGWPATIAAAQHVNAGLLLDATNVYFAGIGATISNGFVGYVPIDGGVSVPTDLAGGQAFPMSMTKDTVNVYWSTYDGAIRSVPIAGGPYQTLATNQGQLGAMATDGVNLYWVATDATGSSAIMKLSVTGNGSPVAVAVNQQQPDTIVVDDTSVYWTDSTAGTVMKLSPK